MVIVRENLDINSCLLYTSDAADERSSVDLGGRRIIKKKNHSKTWSRLIISKYRITEEQDEVDTKQLQDKKSHGEDKK